MLMCSACSFVQSADTASELEHHVTQLKAALEKTEQEKTKQLRVSYCV